MPSIVVSTSFSSCVSTLRTSHCGIQVVQMRVTFSAPSGDPQVSSNTAALTFGPFSADPPNVTHAALVSAASGTTGDLVYFWTLDNARDAANGDSLTVAIGALVMQLD